MNKREWKALRRRLSDRTRNERRLNRATNRAKEIVPKRLFIEEYDDDPISQKVFVAMFCAEQLRWNDSIRLAYSYRVGPGFLRTYYEERGQHLSFNRFNLRQ